MISEKFLFAGNSTFTVSNNKGEHYTFKVESAKNGLTNLNPKTYFVKLLTGPDNSNSYTYLGMIKNGRTVLTNKSKYKKESTPLKVINWALNKILNINASKIPKGYSIDHAGSCGKCGRKLTTPESIKLGLGPVCAGRL